MKKIFYLLIALVFISALSAKITSSSIEYDVELQANANTSFDILVDQFRIKGGTFIVMEEGVEPFALNKNDIVFPSCSGGNNRSQTVWGILRPFADKIRLRPPHATSYGFDPYQGKSNWLAIKEPQSNDKFQVWAGVPKSTKLGWDLFAVWLDNETPSEADLKKMLDYYSNVYFNPAIPEGTRRVYITFTKNAHIHLFRLNQTNDSLDNVVLLLFPLQDLIKHPPMTWNTAPGSVKTYRELSKLISKHLDFSNLEK
ncbi:MAG: hypothetical protein WC222_01275 [Parachlamydiales bacterium]|jgi:hypothetical protein